MSQHKPQQRVMQQELALDVYLGTLLDAVAETEEAVRHLPVDVPTGLVAKTEIVPPIQFEDKKTVVRTTTPLVAPTNGTQLHPLSIMPDWSRREFQALFFKVGHLTLATPLVELSRALSIVRNPATIPGQPSWFIGLLDDDGSRIGVLDTAQLMLGKSRGARDLAATPFKQILVTKDNRWGLACDELLTIDRLTPDKVRWRTGRQKRPWLIGTVIEELTAVIDLDALVPRRKNQDQTPMATKTVSG